MRATEEDDDATDSPAEAPDASRAMDSSVAEVESGEGEPREVTLVIPVSPEYSSFT